ncbi:uncharacterized protein PAPLA1 isoform X1 [Epargyreus clarus]|uniref:uncharacterized protein PAPLA1 isoform X1 n=1 Tax=Epargyreus clarus TaxID=520877 RepID=UPI003C2E8235
MSDRSFGDHAFRSVVKNPLLSTSVTGVSIEDLTQNAVLLPAVPSQEMSARRDERSESQPRALSHSEHDFANLQSGDTNLNIHPPNTITSIDLNPPNSQTSNQNIITNENTNPNVSKASVKSDDDFDVNEYFARLHGTRYVSAPLNSVLKDDQNANLQAVEESLEEINLNEPEKAQSPDIQQSITADIAQNFSQLPTVLPQMASVVFNSFSNMLSMKSRDHTPDESKRYDELKPVEASQPVPDIVKDIAPPPLKEPPIVGTANYRITSKKKVYAQIPGLSTGETAQNTQTYSQPQPTPYYFTPTEPTVPTERDIHTDVTNVNDKSKAYDVFAPVEVKGVTEVNTEEVKQFPNPTTSIQDAYNAPVTTQTVIPPPPMFSNVTKRETQVERTVLPPSVARRISSKSRFILPTPRVPRYSNERFTLRKQPSVSREEPQRSVNPPPSVNVSNSVDSSIASTIYTIGVLPPTSLPSASSFPASGVLPPASSPASSVSASGVLPPARLPAGSVPAPGVLPPASVPPASASVTGVLPPPSSAASTALRPEELPPTDFPTMSVGFAPGVLPHGTGGPPFSGYPSTVLTSEGLPPTGYPTTSMGFAPGVLPPASLPTASAVLPPTSETAASGVSPPTCFPAASTMYSREMLPHASLPSTSTVSASGVLPPLTLPTASTVFTHEMLPPASVPTSSISAAGVLPPASLPSASTVFTHDVLPPASLPATSMVPTPGVLPVGSQTVLDSATLQYSQTAPPSSSVLPPRDISSGYLPPSTPMAMKPPTSTAICPPPIKPSMLPPTASGSQIETVIGSTQQTHLQMFQLAPNATVLPPSSYFSNDSVTQSGGQMNISTPPMFFNPSSSQAQDTGAAYTGSEQNIAQFFNPNDIPPTPTKLVPEPPKASGTNFRMTKKKPQYYSGPIEGVGSISNNVKPVMGLVQSTSFQGSLFTPQDTNELTQSAPTFPSVDSGVGQISSDNYTIPKPLSTDYNSVTQPQSQSNDFNTVFDMSRPSTDRYEPPQQEASGFGLIGSLKSKLSSIDIGKIQNTVTTFFDPAYNDVKTQQPTQETYETYNPNAPSTSTQMQDQAACLEMLIVPTEESNPPIFTDYSQQQQLHTQQVRQQLREQQLYREQREKEAIEQGLHGVNEQHQHFHGHYGTNVHQEPNILEPVAQYFRASGIPVPDCIAGHYNDKSFAERSAAIEAIADALDSGLLNDIVKEKPDSGPLLVYSFGPEDDSDPPGTVYPKVISTLPMDEEEQKKVLEELLTRRADKHGGDFNNIIEPSKTRSPSPVCEPTRYVPPPPNALDDINFTEQYIEQYFANNAGPEYYQDSYVKRNSSSENTCYGSDSSFNFKPYDRPKRGPELEEQMRNMTLTTTLITSNDPVNSMARVETPPRHRDAAVIEPEAEEKEIDDVTKQLIENITAPIQLSNPVEVPLTEPNATVDDNPEFSSNQFAEINNMAEETKETIQVQSATELLQGADVDDTVFRNYGWRTDNVILPSTAQRDAYVNPDTNSIGFLQTAAFFDNVLTNASDELKAECVHSLDEHAVLPRQMSVPTAPPAEEDSKSDESLLDVQSIEQDANKDFMYVHEFSIEPETDDGKIKERTRSSDDHAQEVDSFTNRVEKFKKLEEAGDDSDDVTDRSSKPYPSYFDTGNFAADTHYKNSPQQSFQGFDPQHMPFRIPPGFEQEYYRKYFMLKEHNLEHEFQKQMFEAMSNQNIQQVPDTTTQTSVADTVTTTQANMEDLEKAETSSDKIEALVQKFINRERKYKSGRMKFRRNLPPPLALTLGYSEERARELFGHLVTEERPVLTHTRTQEETMRAIMRHVHYSPVPGQENAAQQAYNDPTTWRHETGTHQEIPNWDESSGESSIEDSVHSTEDDNIDTSRNAEAVPTTAADLFAKEAAQHSGNILFTQLDSRPTTSQHSIYGPSTSNTDNVLQDPVSSMSTVNPQRNDSTPRTSERIDVNVVEPVQLYPFTTKQENVDLERTHTASESRNTFPVTTDRNDDTRPLDNRSEDSLVSDTVYTFKDLYTTDASTSRAVEERPNDFTVPKPIMSFEEQRENSSTLQTSEISKSVVTSDTVNLFSVTPGHTDNVPSTSSGMDTTTPAPLPDPISFFSVASTVTTTTNDDDEEQSSFSRLSSYFSTPTTKEDHSKSFFELSQSQNHYRQNQPISEQSVNSFFDSNVTSPAVEPTQNPQNVYSTNMNLVRELASTKSFFIPPNVVTTANYFTVRYDGDIAFNLNIGEPGVDKTNVANKTPKTIPTDNDKTQKELNLGELGETEPLDDSVIVNKCKHCCNMTGRITKIDIDNTDLNDKIKHVMNSEADTAKTGDNMMEESKEVKKKTPHSVNFDTSSLQEDANEAVAMMSENRSSSEYSPVKFHWFYRVDVEEKSVWRGFSVTDSRTLERTFHSPDLNENTLVPTDGGRYDVNVVARQRIAVYWPDKPTNVRRCSWFYKGTTDARYVPYTEQVAEKLEEEYRHGVTTGEWHRRLSLPNNEMVVMHGPAVMVHFLQTNNEAFNSSPMFSFGKRVYRNPPKIRVSEDQRGRIDHLVFLVHGAGEFRHQREKVQSMMRPRVVRRGCAESEIEDSEPSGIDHLLFLCHGVGSACDMRFRPVEEVVDDFRATSLQLLQSHYRNSYDNGLVGRVEVCIKNTCQF